MLCKRAYISKRLDNKPGFAGKARNFSCFEYKISVSTTILSSFMLQISCLELTRRDSRLGEIVSPTQARPTYAAGVQCHENYHRQSLEVDHRRTRTLQASSDLNDTAVVLVPMASLSTKTISSIFCSSFIASHDTL